MTSNVTVEQIKIAEIKLPAFVVEHNLSFQVMDHLSDLVKEIFPDSNLLACNFKSKHTKTRSIIKNVLAHRFRYKGQNKK